METTPYFYHPPFCLSNFNPRRLASGEIFNSDIPCFMSFFIVLDFKGSPFLTKFSRYVPTAVVVALGFLCIVLLFEQLTELFLSLLTVFQVFKQGFFSALIMAVLSLVSAVVAFNYYEPLGALLNDQGMGNYGPYGAALMVIFVLTLLVL